jgi:hypothetical protein
MAPATRARPTQSRVRRKRAKREKSTKIVSPPLQFQRFFDLPLEIRSIIYELVLGPGRRTFYNKPPYPSPAVLRVCKGFYEEVSPIINKRGIQFYGPHALFRALKNIASKSNNFFGLVPHLELWIVGERDKEYYEQGHDLSKRDLDELRLKECILDITKSFPKLQSLDLIFPTLPRIFTENGELMPNALETFALLCSVSELSLSTFKDGNDTQHPLSVRRRYYLDRDPSPTQLSWCALRHAMICYNGRPQEERIVSSEKLANLFRKVNLEVQDPSFLEDEASVFDCKTCREPHPRYDESTDISEFDWLDQPVQTESPDTAYS